MWLKNTKCDSLIKLTYENITLESPSTMGEVLGVEFLFLDIIELCLGRNGRICLKMHMLIHGITLYKHSIQYKMLDTMTKSVISETSLKCWTNRMHEWDMPKMTKWSKTPYLGMPKMKQIAPLEPMLDFVR